MVEQSHSSVIVVADASLAQRLRGGDAVRGPIIEVGDYLAAIGEMSRRSVRAVIGRIEPMGSQIEATVQALRQMTANGFASSAHDTRESHEPARLMLVVDADQEPAAMRAVRLGFDDYFVQPLSHDQLLRALNVNGHAAPPPSPEMKHPTVETPTPMQPNPAAPAAASPALASPPAVSNRRIGDVDLVEQLLRDRSGFDALAMQVITQRVGHDGVKLVEKLDEAAPPAASVEVHFGGTSLGYLVSDRVPAAQLTGYANWLARWLTLERHLSRLSDLALRDQLTDVWNRRYFDRFLHSILERARVERFRVTVMLYDIDDFKNYNDRYGHPAGDEILIETAKLMASVVRKHDVVARIGGDEFAVIFWDAEPPRRESSEHPHSVRTAAERFQRAVCEHRFPKLADQVHGTLTISGGLASYPWDGATPDALYEHADQMLLQSKQQGKNALTFGAGAMRVCGLIDDEDQADV